MAMNLGSANLKHVNKSQPQLVHSSSQHSISASDHFYSVSESGHSASSGDATVLRRPATNTDADSDKHSQATTAIHAPRSPLRPVQLPTQQRPLVDAPLPGAFPESRTHLAGDYDHTDSEHETTASERSYPEHPRSFLLQPGDGDRTPRRSATAASDMGSWRGSRAAATATPGADDTPYIHFAIDQLTRDEELLGHSRDAPGSPHTPPPPPSVSPLSHREHDRLHSGGVSPPELAAQKPLPRSPSPEPMADAYEDQPRTPLQQPLQHDGLTPPNPPRDMYRYPPLTFVPAPLRLVAVGLLAAACALLIALLALSAAWSAKHQGLWAYDGVGTARYFAAEYLPQLVAVLVLMQLVVMQQALQRILPFVLLAQPSRHNRDILGSVPLHVTSYLLPNASLLRSRRPVLQYAAVSFWLALFTVPLASALFQTRSFGGGWKWATVQPVAIALIALYANLAVSAAALCIWLRRGPTGLKWDPVSLADILVLLRKSALIPADSGLAELSRGARSSLGYWQSDSSPGDFFHGLALNQTTTRLHIERGKAVARGGQPGPPHVSTFESWRSTSKRTALRPRYIHPACMAVYAAIALVLFAAFAAATYVHSALERGFDPLLATATGATASFASFSPSNFVFSFVPALVGLFQPLLWASIDAAARLLAPYLALVRAGNRGVPAEASVLLPYAADGPFAAPLRALSHGHAAVAASSALALLSWALPVVGGGIFTAQYVGAAGPGGGEIAIRADPAGLGALTAFAAVCALGWVAAWPVSVMALRGGSRDEKGARAASLEEWLGDTDVRYLAGVREAVGDAILTSRVWREPRTREDLVGRLVGRGRGRWSWGSQGSGVQKMDV